MSATDYTRYPNLRIDMDNLDAYARGLSDRIEAQFAARNADHIKHLIQKAIEDDNLHAANWLRGHLAKQEADNG